MFDVILQIFDLAIAWRRDLGANLSDHGLHWVWRLLHYLTDLKTWAICLVPVLLLQWWKPARPIGSGYWSSFAHDWLYPVFVISIASHLVVPVVDGIYSVGRAVWPSGPGKYVEQLPFAAQFILAFIIQDFLRYVSHYLRHKVLWLWHFHAIHHSQVNLNPATTYRTHSFEAFVSAILMTLPIGLIGIEPVPWIYGGVTSLFWDFFIHSNVRTNLGLLGYIIVSPQYHRVHHSSLPEHFDTNFGERLVIWDVLFGTRSPDRDSYPTTGCPESAYLMEQPHGPAWPLSTWLRLFLYPFRCLLKRPAAHQPAGGSGVKVSASFPPRPPPSASS